MDVQLVVLSVKVGVHVTLPLCETALLISNSEDVETTLSIFTRENFVQGNAAYHLGGNRYAVDAGENDLRAIFDEERLLVKFFCRYKEEKARYEIKIQSFANKHDIGTTKLESLQK